MYKALIIDDEKPVHAAIAALGNFREYEHTSHGPISAGLSRTYAKTIGGSVTVSSALKIKLGSYDWRKLDVSEHIVSVKYFSPMVQQRCTQVQ